MRATWRGFCLMIISNQTSVVGGVYGKWTVLSVVGRDNRRRLHVIARCSCGVVKKVDFYHLRYGHSTKCDSCKSKTHGHSVIKSGAYMSWKSLTSRCYQKRKPYGLGRIVVCARWRKFENFLKDMGERPPGHTIGRINHSLGYSKKNCRWETMAQQSLNKTTSRMITLRGVTKCLDAWCKEYAISSPHVYIFKSRFNTTHEDALLYKIHRSKTKHEKRWSAKKIAAWLQAHSKKKAHR